MPLSLFSYDCSTDQIQIGSNIGQLSCLSTICLLPNTAEHGGYPCNNWQQHISKQLLCRPVGICGK